MLFIKYSANRGKKIIKKRWLAESTITHFIHTDYWLHVYLSLFLSISDNMGWTIEVA
jgi:hypothetical protein